MAKSEQAQEALRELERDIHTDIVPGTELMTDIGDYHFVKSRDNQTVLVPQPSKDPADPLNWSRGWKFAAVGSTLLATAMQILGPLAIAPIFPILAEEFQATLPEVLKFTGVTILLLGFSNCLWVGMAHTYGRRFTFLASTAVLIGSCIWRALATSYNSFYGAAILSGVGSAAAEAMEPMIITDVLFLHERGFYNTLFFAVGYGFTILGPILQGVMAQRYGWRSFWWMNTALNILAFLVMLVALPETIYHREPETGATALAGAQAKDEAASDQNSAEVPVGSGKPSRKQFKLMVWDSNPWLKLAQGFYFPFKLFLFPIVLWASLIVTFASNCYLAITFVQAEAFGAPPYNFDSTAIGFTNFAALVGAFIGLLSAGPFSDWVSAKMTARNNGIREPEMRLLALIPYSLFMIIGNFVVAYGLENQLDWRPIVIVGITISGMTITALPSIAATYAVDSYKAAAGYIFVTVTIVKTVYGYGVSNFIAPWVMSSGYIPFFMSNMCILIVWLLLSGLLWVYGKRLRAMTAKSDVHRL